VPAKHLFVHYLAPPAKLQNLKILLGKNARGLVDHPTCGSSDSSSRLHCDVTSTKLYSRVSWQYSVLAFCLYCCSLLEDGVWLHTCAEDARAWADCIEPLALDIAEAAEDCTLKTIEFADEIAMDILLEAAAID
jgi:hypothetical protein